MAKKATRSGPADPLPLPPGNRKSVQPPRREEAGGALPCWLDPESAAWPKSEVDAVVQRLKAKAGSYEIGTTKDTFPHRGPPPRTPSPGTAFSITETVETRDRAGCRELEGAGDR